MNKRFTQIPISKIPDFTKVERYRLQKGTHRYVITSCGEIAGFLLPISELGTLPPCYSTYDVTLSDFRKYIDKLWSLLSSETRDCIYITFHNRRIFAFVSSRLVSQQPVIEKEKKHGLSISNP